MAFFDVTIRFGQDEATPTAGRYSKTVRVEAQNKEEAEATLKAMFGDTAVTYSTKELNDKQWQTWIGTDRSEGSPEELQRKGYPDSSRSWGPQVYAGRLLPVISSGMAQSITSDPSALAGSEMGQARTDLITALRDRIATPPEGGEITEDAGTLDDTSFDPRQALGRTSQSDDLDFQNFIEGIWPEEGGKPPLVTPPPGGGGGTEVNPDSLKKWEEKIFFSDESELPPMTPAQIAFARNWMLTNPDMFDMGKDEISPTGERINRPYTYAEKLLMALHQWDGLMPEQKATWQQAVDVGDLGGTVRPSGTGQLTAPGLPADLTPEVPTVMDPMGGEQTKYDRIFDIGQSPEELAREARYRYRTEELSPLAGFRDALTDKYGNLPGGAFQRYMESKLNPYYSTYQAGTLLGHRGLPGGIDPRMEGRVGPRTFAAYVGATDVPQMGAQALQQFGTLRNMDFADAGSALGSGYVAPETAEATQRALDLLSAAQSGMYSPIAAQAFFPGGRPTREDIFADYVRAGGGGPPGIDSGELRPNFLNWASGRWGL